MALPHQNSIIAIIAVMMVVVMMMMVMVSAITITGPYNDTRSVAAIIAVMVMMMMMMVLNKELSQSDLWRDCGFIDSLQLFHGIRNRLQQVGEGTGLQDLRRVGYVAACAG